MSKTDKNGFRKGRQLSQKGIKLKTKITALITSKIQINNRLKG